jgi:hypothetical protein
MKQLNVLIILSLAITLGCSEKDGEEIFEEVPEDIIPSKPCETLYGTITGMFPEHKYNHELHPVLFKDTVQKQIVLTKDADIYVSFIYEGASIANSFGWYAYNVESPPQSRDDVDMHIVFPHVSSSVLARGDMLRLGDEKFKAGTVIGFFLIVGGWNENGTINYNRPTHFTDPSLNTNGNQQHVVFKEGNCGDIVLAFEDKDLSIDSDYDYNDLIFTIFDNDQQLQTVSFDLQKVVVL